MTRELIQNMMGLLGMEGDTGCSSSSTKVDHEQTDPGCHSKSEGTNESREFLLKTTGIKEGERPSRDTDYCGRDDNPPKRRFSSEQQESELRKRTKRRMIDEGELKVKESRVKSYHESEYETKHHKSKSKRKNKERKGEYENDLESERRYHRKDMEKAAFGTDKKARHRREHERERRREK